MRDERANHDNGKDERRITIGARAASKLLVEAVAP